MKIISCTIGIQSILLCTDHRPTGGGRGVQPGRLPAFGEHHLENIWRANQKQSPAVWNRGGQVFYFCTFPQGQMVRNVFRLRKTECRISLRASDLVMKVDALLSSQPKGDARVEYDFADDRYR